MGEGYIKPPVLYLQLFWEPEVTAGETIYQKEIPPQNLRPLTRGTVKGKIHIQVEKKRIKNLYQVNSDQKEAMY